MQPCSRNYINCRFYGNQAPSAPEQALRRLNKPVFAVLSRDGSSAEFYSGGRIDCEGAESASAEGRPLLAFVPPLRAEDWGNAALKRECGIKYACLSGSMANGIASEALVVNMAKAGMMGFFGSAGLGLRQVEDHIDSLKKRLPSQPFGCNLIYNPHNQPLEAQTAELFIRKDVAFIEASAYLTLNPSILHYRYSGVKELPDGSLHIPHKVFAKVSRPEVAAKFLSPPPPEMLRKLVEEGKLTSSEAALASRIPPAYALTAEADSGGHTDNRPALALIPAVISLRDSLCRKYGWHVYVGAAGGVSTPESAAAMFAMGADYVMTGTINQACQESGSSSVVREMLSKATGADVMMAPAADMFEMGVNVQVLKWGTMFPIRARRLYEIYRAYASYDEVPDSIKTQIERDMLRQSFDRAWESTKAFFRERDPQQIAKADGNPKYKMALVFRSYLGQASRWANAGIPDRKTDYQIWCGPSIGSFNQWCKGTFLEDVKERHADLAALNILAGACVITRANLLRSQGIELPGRLCSFSPLPYNELASLLQESVSVRQ
ncbi:PfaD family polyunsaturated fatty acid/polyketide biosynthesis protein [bacterium]|nr:PfaD family polyunsaturated fatty acid/polyketide biosynthesis protein [bacterium]